MKNLLRKILPPAVPFLILVAALETAVRVGLVKDFILPAPTQVIRAFGTNGSELAAAWLDTALAAAIGLCMSFVAGTAIAIGLSVSGFLRRAFLPYAIFFQTVPIISIAPLLVIWFGFGRPTVIASAFIVSIFPIVASTLLGLQSTEPALVDLFRLYSARRSDFVFLLRIPFAAPHIFSGLRIGAGLAVIGAIVGEFIGGGGLGSVVDAARTQQRIDVVFAAVLLSSVLGLALVGLVNFAAWVFLRRWHVSAQIQ